jgi:hypothetical protein
VIRHLTMLRVCQLIKTNHGWNLVVTLIDTAKEIKFLQKSVGMRFTTTTSESPPSASIRRNQRNLESETRADSAHQHGEFSTTQLGHPTSPYHRAYALLNKSAAHPSRASTVRAMAPSTTGERDNRAARAKRGRPHQQLIDPTAGGEGVGLRAIRTLRSTKARRWRGRPRKRA